MTTRKQLYKIMSTFSDDATYQDILWHTYKSSVQMDICYFAPIVGIPIYILLMCIGWYTKIWVINEMVMFIYIVFRIYTINLDPVIDKDTVDYLNTIMKKNCKIIEDNQVHLLKDNNDKLRIVVNGEIVKEKFPFQESIDKYQVQKKMYFVIDEKGHIYQCTDHILLCDGQIVQEHEENQQKMPKQNR